MEEVRRLIESKHAPPKEAVAEEGLGSGTILELVAAASIQPGLVPARRRRNGEAKKWDLRRGT